MGSAIRPTPTRNESSPMGIGWGIVSVNGTLIWRLLCPVQVSRILDHISGFRHQLVPSAKGIPGNGDGTRKASCYLLLTVRLCLRNTQPSCAFVNPSPLLDTTNSCPTDCTRVLENPDAG